MLINFLYEIKYVKDNSLFHYVNKAGELSYELSHIIKCLSFV